MDESVEGDQESVIVAAGVVAERFDGGITACSRNVGSPIKAICTWRVPSLGGA